MITRHKTTEDGRPFTAATAAGSVVLALDSDGRFHVLGTLGNSVIDEMVAARPAEVDLGRYKAIHASGTGIGLVTTSGELISWGNQRNNFESLTPSTTNAVDISMGGTLAAALLDTGEVITWGTSTRGGLTVPEEAQSGVVQVEVNGEYVVARKADGTLVGWGDSRSDRLSRIPTSPVIDFALRSSGGVALTAEGAVIDWSSSPGDDLPPTEYANVRFADIAVVDNYSVLGITTTGDVLVWGSMGAEVHYLQVPEDVAGGDIAFVSSNRSMTLVLTEVAALSEPTITGTAKVGQTLTGEAGTFSGGTEVSHQWFAGDNAIDGATDLDLTLTEAHIGKKITLVSIAENGEDDPVKATSKPTSAVEANTVESTTTIAKASGTYGKSTKVTVNVKAGGGTVTGKVTLSGAGRTLTANVSSGKATFALDKKLAPRKYSLTARYLGGGKALPSSARATVTISKAKPSRVSLKVNSKPTSKRTGKVTVTIKTTSGLAKASGKVTVTMKGPKSLKAKGTVKNGKATVKLPKLKKGTWKIQVTYAGNSNYSSTKSSTLKLKST